MTFVVCPFCTLKNSSEASRCEACANELISNHSKGSTSMVHDLSYSPNALSREPFIDVTTAEDGISNETCKVKLGDGDSTKRIACGRCTFLNAPNVTECEACGDILQVKKLRGVPVGRLLGEDCVGEVCEENGSSTTSETLTEGVMTLLHQRLQQEPRVSDVNMEGNCGSRGRPPTLCRYRLGCVCTPHISQKGVAVGGDWSCGFRNIQMMCHALMALPPYRARMFGGAGDVPDVHGLQAWIEKAWRAGFDVEGAFQLGGSLLGSDTWIGATECVALLRYMGVRARLVDFSSLSHHLPADPPAPPPASCAVTPSSSKEGTGTANTSDSSNCSRSNSSSSTPLRSDTKGEAGVIVLDDSDSDGGDASGRDGRCVVGVEDSDSDFEEPWGGSKSAVTSLKRKAAVDALASSVAGKDEEGNGCECNDDKEKISRRVSKRKKRPLTYGYGSSSRNRQSCASSNKSVDESLLYSWVEKYYNDASEQWDLSMWLGSKGRMDGDGACVCGECDRHDSSDGLGADGGGDDAQKRCVFVPPLYFQHQGHSRTVVGYERRIGSKPASSLFVFDPNSRGKKLLSNLEENKGWQVMVKRGVHTLYKAEYQIVYVEPGLVDENSAEYQQSKIMDSKSQHRLWKPAT